ncbi:MAG TPA: glycosyltransferase family 39 protein, partial [Thermoanaerobaculia bacterium]|nr:glycosyltransferase family 39 protein [Thermoanaerobaculia bacterium]
MLAALLLVVAIDQIPGLHFDELNSISLAFKRGELDQGVQSYTGTLYYELAGAWMSVAGFTPRSLRLFSVLLNCLACVAAIACVRRVAPGSTAGAWVGCLVATSPPFVMKGRLGWEVTAMHPVLAAIGILAAVAAFQASRRRYEGAYALAAGIAFGAAASVHLSALPLLPAVVAAALVARGGSV